MSGAATGAGTEGTFSTLNKMLVFTLVFVALGCTVKTQIIEPDGSIYIVESKTDSMVTMKNGGWEITVDNRGKPNIFESLLGWLLLKTPEVAQAK